MGLAGDGRTEKRLAPALVVTGDKDQIAQQIRAGIETILGTKPLPTEAQYTHWFSNAQVHCPYIGADGIDAMNRIAEKFLRFRSNSTQHKERLLGHKPIPGDPNDFPCWADHDLLRNYLVAQSNPAHQLPSAPPMRTRFGLPQNYTFGSLKQNPNKATVMAVQPTTDGRWEEIDRRGSPLLIHFHKVATGVAVILTYAPSEFLPPKSEIRFTPRFDLDEKKKAGPDIAPPPDSRRVPSTGDWKAIEDFLSTL